MESKEIINKIKDTKEIKVANKNGLPSPKHAKCSSCGTKIIIKFVISRGDYSNKNTLEFWSEGKGNTKICNGCLRKLYYNKSIYWEIVKNLKRRNLLKHYIRTGLV